MNRLCKAISCAAVAALAFGPMIQSAEAAGRNPGSLLVYPIFDSGSVSDTLISVTNIKDDPSFNPNTNLNGVIDAHFIYINGEDWREFNRFERLTPSDVFSVWASAHNPNMELGFLYVVALDPMTRQPADLDYLIGDEIVANGESNFLYAVEAIPFKGLTGDGNPTDVDADGMLDLDGIEYEAPADELFISSFVAQNGVVTSELILCSLVGDGNFTLTLDFAVFNNNEIEFSATVDIDCWEKIKLTDIDLVFSEAFLATTMTDPAAAILTGWARIDGDRAVDRIGNAPQINDPAFCAALVQSYLTFSVGHLLHESDEANPTPGALDAVN